ncbi:hypothetical protein [Saccharopolyspora sp. ASAGF58]|nr:hypothetical protein [Saccharopolyspora sp. ASAGF58]
MTRPTNNEITGPGEPRVLDGPGARSTLLCGVYEFARTGRSPPR